ncbi:MAG: hypothetical protein AMXMBFR20_31100 [Planctomycetia bacterium]|jgi:hypothetical protein
MKESFNVSSRKCPLPRILSGVVYDSVRIDEERLGDALVKVGLAARGFVE